MNLRQNSHQPSPWNPRAYVTCLFVLVAALPAWAQQSETPPKADAAATVPPSTEPSAEARLLPATVLTKTGRASWAAPGVSPLSRTGWTEIKPADQLAPGTQIRTSINSSLTLQFGSTTFVSIRQLSLVNINDAYRSATKETVRIDLGYGTIRGTSLETPVESDVVVESTNATLVKRGTDGWQMYVEANTGRYEVSLATSGLVEAIQKNRNGTAGSSRNVRPGEYVTDQTMALTWLEQARFDRTLEFYDPTALTPAEQQFAAGFTGGFDVVAAGGGREVIALSQANAASTPTSSPSLPQLSPGQPTPPIIILEPVVRPEGNFGTSTTYRVRLPR